MDRFPYDEVELFCVCAWQIWYVRNDLYFEKVYVSPELCYKRAHDMLSEYRKANYFESKAPHDRRHAHWVSPSHDTIKINVDAAVNMLDDRVGVGVVARNSEGKVLLSAAKSISPVTSVERAELEAFKWAVELVKNQNWDKVIFEGDAQVVVKALQGNLSRDFHSQIVVDNILLTASSLAHHSFLFCFREANRVARPLCFN